MDLELLGYNWNLLGEADPMWAILMDPQRRGNRWDKCEFFQTGEHDIRYAMEKVAELRFPLRRGKALDFGCGLGRLTQAMACYFDQVSGVDISPAMIRGAGQYNPYGERCQFFVNERDDLKLFPDNHFDFVLSLLVLQHMRPDYIKRYVAEFVRVLAPGGLVLFQLPSHYCHRALPIDYRPLSYRIRSRAQRLVQGKFGRLVARDGEWGYDFTRIAVPSHHKKKPNVDEAASVRNTAPQQKSDDAQTEIHTITRREMCAYIRDVGGRLVHIEPRNECSPHHHSFRYFVTK